MNRLSVALNIRAGEERLVVLLLTHSFFIGLVKVFTSAAASALFINAYGAQSLPYVYIGVAVVVSLIGVGYTWLQDRLSFKAVLVTNLLALLIGLVGLRGLLAVSPSNWPAAALMIWFEVIWALTSLEFWGLAGRLFDLRQGKRLFGLIGSGDVAAVVISGLAMNSIVSVLGTANLLFIAMLGLLGALALLVYITRRYPDKLDDSATAEASEKRPSVERPSVERPTSSSPPEKSSIFTLFKNRYIALIFAISAVSLLGYYVVDNAFFDQAQMRYTDADQLAAFMGYFLAIGGIASLVFRMLVAGPFMERFGLLGGLLSLPVMVGVGTILIIITGTVWGAIPLIFWLTTITKLFDSSLRFSIFRSGTLVLYQPLSARQQLQAQTAVESFVEPAAGGVAGLLLLLLGNYLGLGTIGLYYLLAVILAGWLVIVFMLNREYVVALTHALTQRRLGGDLLALTDGSSLSVLKQGLNSPHVGQVIYALDVLEETDHESLDAFLRSALRHPAPEVRQEALNRIERRHADSVLRSVRLVVRYERVSQVRAAALRTLAALGGAEVIAEIKPYLDDADLQVRQGALVGLLRSGGIEGVLLAGQRLLEAVNSPINTDRIVAAQVLGEVGISSFYQPLQKLLQDDDVRVCQAALKSVGQLQPPQLWPVVVDLLAWSELAETASSALIAGGENTLPFLSAAFANPAQTSPTRSRIARVCGCIGGEAAILLLKQHLTYPDEDVRLQVLKSLSLCGYHAAPEEVEQIEFCIQNELEDAAWTLTALLDIGAADSLAPLSHALSKELAQNRARLFLLLSFIYHSTSVLQARDILLHKNSPADKRAYALEVLDILLSSELKPAILALFDDSLAVQQCQQQLAAIFPQKELGQTQRLGELVTRFDGWLRPWTSVCALQAVADLSLQEVSPAVVKALDGAMPLIREAAIWTLFSLNFTAHWPEIERLQNDPSPQVARVVEYLQANRHNLAKGAKLEMLSTLEKVFILKSADIFAETPEDALAEIASIVDEVDVPAGETIFTKGDHGHSMYIVFDGRVRIHDGEKTLNELDSRDIFGELALLESEIRLDSATALQDTRLLRLDHASFSELMAERSEVAWGIIRVLVQRIRNLSQLLAAGQLPSAASEKKQDKSRDTLLDGIMSKLYTGQYKKITDVDIKEAEKKQ